MQFCEKRVKIEIENQIHFFEGLKLKYTTKPRRELLDFFKSHDGECYTADELEEKIGGKMGKATLYRTLSAFSDEGIIVKYYTGDGMPASYMIKSSEECDSHFHLRCLVCGKLFHVDCDVMDETIEHIKREHGFTVDVIHSTMYGVCRECEAKKHEKD